MQLMLRNLAPGTGFAIPQMKTIGRVLDVNDCEVRVRISKDGVVQTAHWSPHTVIEKADATALDESLAILAATETFTCACGKTCTSKSGLTLHKQRCTVAE